MIIVISYGVFAPARSKPSLSFPANAGPHTAEFIRSDVRLMRRDSPESCWSSVPRKSEGAGKAGCWLHPQPRVQQESTRVIHHRFSRDTRPSLRNGVNGVVRALPGVHDLLVTVARMSSPRALGTSPGVPGPHVFAVRQPRRSSRDTAFVHRSPPRVRDDAYAPLLEAGCIKLTPSSEK